MFLIVEIVNDKGEKEWKIAPKGWVCTSKKTQRTVLFWPNESSIERQNQLAIEGTCKPLQSWMRKECVIRKEFPSYETANTELQTLLKQHSNEIKEEPEDPLNVEDPAVKTPEPPCATVPDDEASTLARIKSMLQLLVTKNAQREKQNADVVEHNTRIESILFILRKTVDTLERNFTNTLSILNLDNCWYKPTIGQENNPEQKFSFEPMETIEQLKMLDVRLNDESFYAELMQWLLANVYDDTTRSRITSCLDLLCSLELQTKLRMAHLVDLHNFLLLVREIADTPSKSVTLRSLGEILTRCLYNSRIQFFNSNNRSNVPKKRTKPIERTGGNTTVKRKFVFKPRETMEELRELEEKLNDESFNRELLRWLLFNVKDDNSKWRMKSCLDLLCTIELQSKLKWSSRMGSIMKEPVETLPNFVKIFEVVGKTPSEDVTHKEVRQCLSNHLKNSMHRYRLSLNRKRVGTFKRFGTREKSNAVASEQGNSTIAANENSRTEIETD